MISTDFRKLTVIIKYSVTQKPAPNNRLTRDVAKTSGSAGAKGIQSNPKRSIFHKGKRSLIYFSIKITIVPRGAAELL